MGAAERLSQRGDVIKTNVLCFITTVMEFTPCDNHAYNLEMSSIYT
jgi:hypothetical protein